jgi:hypothetical protein
MNLLERLIAEIRNQQLDTMTSLMAGPPDTAFYLTSRGRYLGLDDAIRIIETILDDQDDTED